jgi:hypothetical protein
MSDDIMLVVALVAAYAFLLLFLFAIYYVVSALLMGSLFKKAGVKSTTAWVPFYRYYRFLQLGGQKGSLIFINIGAIAGYIIGAATLAFVPPIGIIFFVLAGAAEVIYYVFRVIAAHNIAKKLDRDGIITVFYVVSELIWWALVVGVSKSVKWDDKAGKARLDK